MAHGIWYMYGACMAYGYGTFMVRIWHIYGAHKYIINGIYIWCMYGICLWAMVHIWCAYGTWYMVHGTHMVHMMAHKLQNKLKQANGWYLYGAHMYT